MNLWEDLKIFLLGTLMKNKLITLSVLTFTPIVMLAQSTSNPDSLKNEVIQYHESGEYDADISKITYQAQCYLTNRIYENRHSLHPKKLAIVLDIDETSLSSYKDIKTFIKILDVGGIFLRQDMEEETENHSVIIPILNLYRYAVKHNVAVFFITGRQEKYRASTIQKLKRTGYTQWTHLHMKPDNYYLKSVVPYKLAQRKTIEKKDYCIVLNVGDQYSDLKGGYSEKDYKLPNFMYSIP